jgi:hypothetical protein
MSNYTKLTDYASKDALPTGTPAKIVKGAEVDAEFTAIETAIATKANSTDVTTSLALKANLASPALTGTPTAPTAAAGTNTTQVATTAFVQTRLTDMTSVDLGAWTITVSGTDLLFAYNSTTVFKLASTGAVSSADDVTAYATL